MGILRDISSRKAAEVTLSKQMELIHLLESLAASANEAETLAEAASVCLTKICSQLDWPIAHIYEVQQLDDGPLLVPMDIWCGTHNSLISDFREATRQQPLRSGEGLGGTVYQTGKPTWIVDVDTHVNFVRKEAASRSGIKSAFAVPVLTRTEVVAVLEFFSNVSAPPDKTVIDVTSYTAAQLGRVVEREQSASKLRHLNAQLENRVLERTSQKEVRDIALAANHAKSAFLANMSHELRTPLNAIIGYAELVQEEVAAAGLESTVRDMNRILRASTHLAKLISDILDLSKIEAGKMDITLSDVHIGEVVRAAAETTGNVITENGNRLNITCQESSTIRADKLRLQQVLVNLLSNAGKFTHDGEIAVTCTRGPAHVEISVRDTGIGISEDNVGKLFQKFEQLDASSTRLHGGTGLGLVISRTLCRLMGGDLFVQSKLGTGSTFTVRLPT